MWTAYQQCDDSRNNKLHIRIHDFDNDRKPVCSSQVWEDGLAYEHNSTGNRVIETAYANGNNTSMLPEVRSPALVIQLTSAALLLREDLRPLLRQGSPCSIPPGPAALKQAGIGGLV